MAGYVARIRKIVLATFLVMVTSNRAIAAAGADDAVADALPVDVAQEQEMKTGTGERVDAAEERWVEEGSPDFAAEETAVETHLLAGGFAGYRFFSVDGFGGRAAEYERLKSNPTFGATLNRLGRDLKLAVDGSFLNDEDYYGDVLFDYQGYYRFHLRTESLFHNLDHEPVFSPAFSLGGNDYVPSDLDPAARYGVKVEQDLAAFRYKLGNYPVHLNLGYWRLLRDGNAQLRFADSAFESPAGTTNTIFSTTRRIERQTHEATIGADAHLGPVDVVYSFLVREFDDRIATPRDFFPARVIRSQQVRDAGVQEHNGDPESRFLAHTVKIHTSLTGGIVGAASYTYGRRSNISSSADIRGNDQARDTIHGVAGDIVYTPIREFSLALKYRRQEIDRETPAEIIHAFSIPATVAVRPPLDTEKDTAAVTLSFRPTNLLTLKGEYRGEFLRRDNVAFWNQPTVAVTKALPEDTTLHRGTFSVLSRPLKGMRLNLGYAYTAVDNPSYGSSSEAKHEGEILASYTRAGRWGATANYRLIREKNDQTSMTTLPLITAPVTLLLPRDGTTSHFATSLWFSPLERLTIGGSYALLRKAADQTVLFSGVISGSQAATNFTSQAQVISVNGSYQLNEKLDLSLVLQHVHSFSEFDPELKSVGVSDTSGIKEISRVRTIENSLSARADYHLTKHFSCALDYTYRDYDNRESTLGEGTVHVVTAMLKTLW